MKITFLGTGTSVGVPQMACHCAVCQSQDERDKRLRASIMVETKEGKRVLLDCGPDFRQQSLRYGIEHVDGILMTHIHFDHAEGINEIRPLQEADIYCERSVKEGILRFYPYLFGEHPYPGAPELRLHEIDAEHGFTLCGMKITPIRAMHGKLPVLGYRFDDELVYLTDFSQVEERESEKMRGVKVAILDALREKEHPSHVNLSQAMELADRLEIPQVYFTHMSHDMGLHAWRNEQLPPSRQLAYDGQVLELE